MLSIGDRVDIGNGHVGTISDIFYNPNAYEVKLDTTMHGKNYLIRFQREVSFVAPDYESWIGKSVKSKSGSHYYGEVLAVTEHYGERCFILGSWDSINVISGDRDQKRSYDYVHYAVKCSGARLCDGY